MSSKRFKGRGRPSQQTMDNVALPTNIKCTVCNVNRVLGRYSNNQLNKYRESVCYKGVLNAERPRCLVCTGGPSSELQCVDCKLYKSLEAFSKNARSKDRDNAHCWECQQKVSDQEPNVEDAIKEAEIEEDYHRKGTSLNMSCMGSSLPSGSKKSSQGTPSEAGTDDSGCVWIQQPLSLGGPAATSRGRAQANVSNEHSRGRSGSQDTAETSHTHDTASTTSQGTWTGFGDDTPYWAPRRSTSPGTASDKWYKQGAVKKTAVEKVMAAVERSTQGPVHQQRPRDEDEDSDSDFEM